ncbi:tRNA binding protein [Kockovaella imperatae]|uniref:Exportin-T n=1 Tax=Kockovaella imperatae TaxID=4999 RepID=A0A1Y1UJN2_9TREE|nr:tRNA binding protein [Kockovaella imperatae]ORX37714.1 tRNA binding protein [Kockovaella imperatae]
MSSHLVQIPQAVSIAASIDPSIDPALKQQAIDYLDKVRQLCEETWQDCLSLWLQGAGAGPSTSSRDGKQKLDTDLRIYCEQVVDNVLTKKATALSPDDKRSIYNALVEYINTEWVSGPCEGGQSFFRNKLASTLAYLFLDTYPDVLPTFLHPFFDLLTPSSNRHPVHLAVHLLSDIALEIHDPTIKSAREFTKERSHRDGLVRDAIRTTGDENKAVEGLINLAKAALEKPEWLDIADQAVRTLATWTPWIDLSVSLTPDTLAFYQRLIKSTPLKVPTATIFRTLVTRGMQDTSERLQVFGILDIASLVDELEPNAKEDDFRAALGTLIGSYATELINMSADSAKIEPLLAKTIPIILRFMSDPSPEVFLSVSQCMTELLRRFKSMYVVKPPPRGQMPPPPKPLSPETRSLMSTILDTSLRKLAWPTDSDWEAPTADEPDPDDDLAQIRLVRTTCRSFIESVAQIDKDLHTDIVARIVLSTFDALARSETVPWQQAELALHLVYTFGELNKANSRAAFYNLPADLLSKAGRDRAHRLSINKSLGESSGRSTPSDDGMIDGIYYGGKERIDYTVYPLTPLGQLLLRCMESGIINYPHPGVMLQYFECTLRYVEFWKTRPGAVQPVIEAMTRGIHHVDLDVRRRCFYLFARFIASSRLDLETEMVSPLLDNLKDLFPIDSALPTPDFPEQDVLVKATTGRSYLSDQLYIYEAAGNLISLVRSDPTQQLALLEAVAAPLVSDLTDPTDSPQNVLKVHNSLMALGHFAKGFPILNPSQDESTLPYEPAFKQLTQALLQTLDRLKTRRIIRDAARFTFSQFVNAIGSSVAELVPGFVIRVVGEYEPSELSDFLQFLSLLMHRLKSNAFSTMDMLLLPLLSRIFSVLQSPITGTDDHLTHNRLKTACLAFFSGIMNANLDGIFITERNKPEFENLLNVLLGYAEDPEDDASQRLAFAFFSRSVIAWSTNASAPSVFADSAMSDKSKAVGNGTSAPTNQHAIPKDARQALPGYEHFIYSRLLPLCFHFPVGHKNGLQGSVQVVMEIAIVIRNTVQARGQEAIDFMLNDLLPKDGCPPEYANQLIQSLKTQQAKDFRHTFVDFTKASRAAAVARQ